LPRNGSQRSFDQIKSILDTVASPEMYDYVTSPYLKPWMETKMRQNGLAWLSMARGMHLKNYPPGRPDTFTERFIKRRAEQEIALLQSGKKIQMDSPSAFFDEYWAQALHDFLLKNTKVEPAFIDRGIQAWAVLDPKKDQPNQEHVGFLLGLYTRLRIDFYYQLLCNLSLDLIQGFKEGEGVSGHEQWLIENSFFGDMVPVFDGYTLTLPFERLLDTWRRNVAPGGKDISWAKIAQSLPNPQGRDLKSQSLAPKQTRDDRNAAIRKNKQSRLREWRKGTRPKPEQLEEFFRNLTVDESSASSAIMRADIACNWGAFILDERKSFESYGLLDALNETLPAFELYPSYWADYKTQAAQIVAA
jgi:hypothetical protein